ncbi:hypothetical protein IAE33_001333 [Pseudomonas sp. S60]|uniref:hypothetical protein n=1 Tax=unclassified Pseudomonas TaxID=196821 RepID=UPI001912739D|nr:MULTISPECIES: hypothetical protein [unclassified Pseudomonas]MBK5006366.1 hypothetical protein [Pseudomonas sp. S32]MBK5009473.1 hypothetical protein [Pseudomonas sp. S60]
MLTASELLILAQEAPQNLRRWSSFVAQIEFVWQNPTLVKNGGRWQALWFEMEIVNGLALAEWEEEGYPKHWSHRWREGYEQDARELVSELLLLICPEPSA